MRKKIKTKIKEILKTLIKAQDHVELLLQKRQLSQAGDLLAQCQQCAVEAGEAIERSEGMGTEVVSCLELYCEQLYHMSQTSDRKEVRSLKNQMENTLSQTRKLIDELPLDPIKVVFMPYKASMWDCMESVWEAAEADLGCEAYVVPIPFYEKNAHGRIEKECYEGDIFPKYVPITHYNEFSLEAEEPDVIYIHNPYDDANYVTSVAPEYYSSNLKRYTDMLVYIPYYFNGSGPLPESHRDLSAYHYVDKIIMQDEEKAESLAESIPREKIAVLGSPKVDRLLKLEKKRQEIIENEIPEEWRKKIAGKKVILFNISVSGILQNSKYAMDKIRYVLSQFKGRDDVVLWWRPHPLIEGTLKSMRQEMYGEYMKIKRGFLKDGKGILDESGDAGIAAVVADAYLGENSSSLVHYFGVLGKPVMYTHWRILEDAKKDRNFLRFHVFYKEGNDIYFIAANEGYGHELFHMNLEDGVLEKFLTLPGTTEHIWASYRGIKRIKNKIILVPYNTEDLYIYDLEENQAIKVVLPHFEGMMRFGEVEEYEESIYLLPVCYPAIIKIDMRNFKIYEYKECIAQFASEDQGKILFLWGYYRREQYLYLASSNESKIIIFNMKSGNFKIEKIGNYEYGYGHMLFDGKYFWLSAFRANYIVRWDENSGETRKYTYQIEQENLKDFLWTSILDHKDKMVVCCGSDMHMVEINKETGKCHRSKAMKDMLNKIEKESVGYHRGFGRVCRWDTETALLYYMGNSTVYLWNMDTDHWKSFPCLLLSNEMIEMEKKWIEKYGICKSIPYCLIEDTVTISQYIDYLMRGDSKIFRYTYECYQGQKNECTIGSQIHESVVSESR